MMQIPALALQTGYIHFLHASSIAVGSCASTTVRIKKPLAATVYLFVNDAGTSPLPFDCATDFPNTTVGECDFCNNMDSFTVNITAIQVDTAICRGSSYFAGGVFQTTAGVYYDTLFNVSGCDTVVVTQLTVLSDTVIHIDVQLCSGDSLFAGGAYQKATGDYTDSFTNSNFCDSVRVTHLTVLPDTVIHVFAELCAGDSLFAGGAYQTTSGDYTDSFTNANMCDSVLVTHLTVFPRDGNTYFCRFVCR